MNRVMIRTLVVEITCFCVIVVFMYAGISKLLGYEKFVVQIGQSPLLTGFGAPLAWSVITSEVLISVLLIFGSTRLIGLYAAFCLMTMFTAYILAILNFSPYVPCSCGGLLESLRWTEHLIFNFVLLGLITGAIMVASNPKPVQAS